MKILFALSRFPYPTDKGDKLRAFHQIRMLSKAHEVYLVCLTREKVSQKELDVVHQLCKEIKVVHLSRSSVLSNMISGTMMGNEPVQTHYFRSEEMKQAIEEMVLRVRIDVCFVQLLRLIFNIPFHLPCSYYLDYMDAFSAGMAKRISVSRWYEKPFVQLEQERLYWYEKDVKDRFDGYSIITQQDADLLNIPDIDVVPNGVDESFFQIEDVPKKYDLIFTGNMGYHPNIQAAKYLVREIKPLLEKKGYRLKICIAGKRPAAEVRALASEDVEVTGFVEDIRTYLWQSKLFAAPLFTGSGLQNKLLEAMAARIPVITTELANAALGAKDGKEVSIGHDAESFATNIAQLMDDTALRQSVGVQGCDYVKQHYDWKACTDILVKRFQELIDKRTIRH